MLSGMIAGGMTAWSTDRWPEYYFDILSNPYAEPANYDPESALYIQKITTSDLQTGTVGKILSKPFQVLVSDSEEKPVKGAEVIFTVKAGGGKFIYDMTTIVISTNSSGIANVYFTLGEETSSNPTMWWGEGDINAQQVGQNIIDARLVSGSGASVSRPFIAFGLPGELAEMRELHGDYPDTVSWSILSFVGFVSVIIEDEYGNPISNLPVDFSVPTPTPQCVSPSEDK